MILDDFEEDDENDEEESLEDEEDDSPEEKEKKEIKEEINNSKRITNTKIVEEIKKIIDDYNSNGKRIDLEEFDFEEMTQLILKIHK